MPAVEVFQIFYDEASRRKLDPGFTPLDNTANERPDWREYWPMRNYLLSHELAADTFYGFLSPRFGEKYDLTSAMVAAFAAQSNADVVIFSPPFEFYALFWNVFAQGEYAHPGLLEVARDWLAGTDLETLVTDSRNTVYSNFFLARAAFWRAWLELGERLFAAAEQPAHPLAAKLNACAPYQGAAGVHFKVFIMERLASFLLATLDQFAAEVHVAGHDAPIEAVACDALKIAYTRRPDPAYREAFNIISGRMIASVNAAGQGRPRSRR